MWHVKKLFSWPIWFRFDVRPEPTNDFQDFLRSVPTVWVLLWNKQWPLTPLSIYIEWHNHHPYNFMPHKLCNNQYISYYFDYRAQKPQGKMYVWEIPCSLKISSVLHSRQQNTESTSYFSLAGPRIDYSVHMALEQSYLQNGANFLTCFTHSA